jgi:hypothetical protein
LSDLVAGSRKISVRKPVNATGERVKIHLKLWDSELVPLLKERPALMPTTLLEMLQDKYPGHPNNLRRTMQRRVRE